MYSLPASAPYDELNVLLRKATVGPRVFEISTLVPAREFNQQYEWSAHEIGARRAGVSDEVIDTIKYDRPVTGLPEKDAAVIEFGRALLRGDRQVPSELFANGGPVRPPGNRRDHDDHGRLRDDGHAPQRGRSTSAARKDAFASSALKADFSGSSLR
jgi:hypothetical protein